MTDYSWHQVLNEEQKAAVYCTKNAVIAAGAGSGKTMVLASRYAYLVTEKNLRVREILTLTFTKKATVQMYRRIHMMLSEIARKDKSEKGKRAQQAIDEFSEAKIQTLDSYCTVLVKQAASRYGISPDFKIDNDFCKQLARDEAFSFLISHRNHKALELLYQIKNPSLIAQDIFASALLGFSNFGTTPGMMQIASQFSVICREWDKQRCFITEKLRELDEVYSGNENYHLDIAPLLGQYNNGQIIFPDEKELRDYFDKLACIPDDSVIDWAEAHNLQDEMELLIKFISSLKTLNMSKGSPPKNPAKAIINELRAKFDEFSSLVVYCMQAGLIYSVLTLLSNLEKQYLNKKRIRGTLTFLDVAHLARTILLEQGDIRQNEKESYKSIMIDEFQDNNSLQKDLLFLLAEKPEVFSDSIPKAEDLSPEKLFFVGDEKQSIYRFRGADVSVFRELRNELRCPDMPLRTNYRSAPVLIDAFNAIFGGHQFGSESTVVKSPAVFAPDSPAGSSLPSYEAAYTPLRAGVEDEGKLTLCILDKEDSADFDKTETNRLTPVENEARYVAERIRDLLGKKDKNGTPKYQPKDIAILLRSRGPQNLFEKHLRLLNIPYASENLSSFFFGGPVNDLMSVLRLAAYPLDRAAYAEMLRSPFIGLSLPALVSCIAAINESPSAEPFGNEPLPLLPEEERNKYIHGQQVYQKIRNGACSKTICSLVSELWYGEGYRYETEWNPQTSVFRELYDYLFHLATRADEENQNLAAFIDTIQKYYEKKDRLDDIEIPLDHHSTLTGGTVTLMSIHKSKGLEFPVVFLCCCDKYIRKSHGSTIFSIGESGITLNPPLPVQCVNIPDIKRNYFWERSIAAEKGKRTAELRRLLYVGMTRAEKELYLSGCMEIGSEDENGKPESADGFLQSVKRHIEELIAGTKKKNSINGDTIIDNDTFFGLCLPSFGAHIPADSPGTTFFNIEKIPVYSEEYINDAEQKASTLPNDQNGLNAFFELVEPYYKSTTVIETPAAPNRYYSPTSLKTKGIDVAIDGTSCEFSISNEYSGENAKDVFSKVDVMLDRYAKQYGEDNEKFNSGSFGTIAHICAEALLAGKEAIIPPGLGGFLSPAGAEAFLNAGKELALRFIRSPLGIIAKNSLKRKSEFPFRSLVNIGENEFFINGIIDLVFEDDKTVYVVDFKTDLNELPMEHASQMACYHRAVSDLFAAQAGKKCRTWLYYLRTGHAVELGFNSQ